MGKEREKWMEGRFLDKRRKKMLGVRLLLSRVPWKKDGDWLGVEENGREGRLGETERRGGKWRTVEEKREKTHGRMVGRHSRGGRAEEDEVDGGRGTALRTRCRPT